MTTPTALIVEDDKRLCDIFAEAVKAAGYEVTRAYDGLEAQALLQQSVPDLVVLDLHLPGVMGPDLEKQIRSDPRLSETRVVIATADHRMAEELRERGNFILLKPISVQQLRTLAERLRRPLDAAAGR